MPAMFWGLTIKATAVIGVAAAILAVTGESGPTLLNTTLNWAGLAAAWIAARLVSRLKRKIEEGDTPGTQLTIDLKDAVHDLRGIVLDLREELARGGVIDRRDHPNIARFHGRRDSDPA